MITVTVLWIVFGAILMLNTLKHTGAITAIRGGFTNISPDGASRPSSSPGASAPLSKGLGFWHPGRHRRAAAGSHRLSGARRRAARHDDPVHPGVVRRGGHPILVGINKGLDNQAIGQTLSAGGSSWDIYLQQVTTNVALIHAIVGTLMPVLMVMMLTRFFGRNRSWTEGSPSCRLRFSPGSPSPSPMPSPACCSAPSSRPSSAAWWGWPWW